MANIILTDDPKPTDQYQDAQAVHKPSGAILLDGQHVADTVQCVHCAGHFVMLKGSGVERGWCLNCGGVFCGPQCARCRPFERWLDQVEAAAHTRG